ncbi:MAG: hypothetical protein ACMXYA_03130 [Candidatus Woesearchaeota archaeon]
MREYIEPDKNKAKSLFKMADELLRRVELISFEEFPAPNLSDYYDIIHMFLDGLLLCRGLKFKGEGAHYELIEGAKQETIITESEAQFLQQIRNIRNKHKYEGFSVSVDFAKRNKEKIKKIIDK